MSVMLGEYSNQFDVNIILTVQVVGYQIHVIEKAI